MIKAIHRFSKSLTRGFQLCKELTFHLFLPTNQLLAELKVPSFLTNRPLTTDYCAQLTRLLTCKVRLSVEDFMVGEMLPEAPEAIACQHVILNSFSRSHSLYVSYFFAPILISLMLSTPS